MIAKLTGIIDTIRPTELILDVGGVGYQLNIPLTTFEKIHGQKEITLHVFTLHKEDQFKLFGFHSEREKNLFSILLSISGIGPSMAISVLSGISPEGLISAVHEENSLMLTKIPGIGKGKAEKLVFELKRKLKKIEEFIPREDNPHSAKSDAVEALVSLGYDESRAVKTVHEVLSENPDHTIEGIIKESLKALSS